MKTMIHMYSGDIWLIEDSLDSILNMLPLQESDLLILKGKRSIAAYGSPSKKIVLNVARIESFEER